MNTANASLSPTVFVIDDEAEVRRSLERLVRSTGLKCEIYPSAAAFVGRPVYDGIGCLLLDVSMPGMTGPELQERMLAMGVSLPIIYLTGHADVPMSVCAMKRGAFDILQKPAKDVVIIAAIESAIARHALIKACEDERTQVEACVARLSAREREVMELVISGRLNKQIASDLGITEKTVKAHRARVMEKLETRSVAELVRLCALVGIEPQRRLPMNQHPSVQRPSHWFLQPSHAL
jgi:FixJ family two-component response regulator